MTNIIILSAFIIALFGCRNFIKDLINSLKGFRGNIEAQKSDLLQELKLAELKLFDLEQELKEIEENHVKSKQDSEIQIRKTEANMKYINDFENKKNIIDTHYQVKKLNIIRKIIQCKTIGLYK